MPKPKDGEPTTDERTKLKAHLKKVKLKEAHGNKATRGEILDAIIEECRSLKKAK